MHCKWFQISVVTICTLTPFALRIETSATAHTQKQPSVSHEFDSLNLRELQISLLPDDVQERFRDREVRRASKQFLVMAAADDDVVPADDKFIQDHLPKDIPPAPKPSPTPAPEPKPQPKPNPEPADGKPPVIKIEAPQYVDLNNFIHVQIKSIGGAIREQEITIDPEPDKANFAFGFSEVQVNGETVRVEDQSKFHFTVPKPGIVTITVLAIGQDIGYAKTEARIQVRDPRPAPASGGGTNKAVNSDDPRVQLRHWVSQVNSKNRQNEAKDMAKAARATAARMRPPNPEVKDENAIEEWQQAAYLIMGPAFKNWNLSASADQRSFFAYVTDLYNQNLQLKDSNAANFLISIAEILEGK